MAKNDLSIKLWLINKTKKSRRMPLFVVAKTKRRILRNKFVRNWRRDKLLVRNLRKNKRKQRS